MAKRRRHIWDEVADNLTEWLDTEPDHIAEAISGRGPSPFSARVTEKQKLDYYRRQFFNDDGSENAEGRSYILNRVGIKGYVQIHQALNSGSPPEPDVPADTSEGY